MSKRPKRHPSDALLYATVKRVMAQTIRRELKKALFAGRAQVPCCFCHKPLYWSEATLEHIRPKSRGGPTTLENLTISCQPCNSRRGDMGYEKFRGRFGRSGTPA